MIELFKHKSYDIFIPDGAPIEDALNRTSHLAIGAHSDDLEIMAYHGIVNCYGHGEQLNKNWFTGVTATDGRGSSRAGLYSECSDEEMAKIRKEEQNQAAVVGRYSAMLQLGYSSDEILNKKGSIKLKEDLLSILKETNPIIVYTHNISHLSPVQASSWLPIVLSSSSLTDSQSMAFVFGNMEYSSLVISS